MFQDTAGEPLYKLFKALKHQVEKGPVDAKMKKAKYTLNDTGLLGDDVEYSVLVSTHKYCSVRVRLGFFSWILKSRVKMFKPKSETL